MHGVKRTRVAPVADSAQVERTRRDRQREQINVYTTLVSELQHRMSAQDYSHESLNLTTKVLGVNPEFHTAWSMRRTILLKGLLSAAESSAARQSILDHDLDLTNRSLKANPKNYSVWEHRKWVLETMPDADWAFEIKVVELYLEKDGRNFHSWDYRRYLIDSIIALYDASSSSSSSPSSSSRANASEARTKLLSVPRPTTESELQFTTKKISENFSNFSAWHYRTKLLTKLWQEKGWTDESNPDRVTRVDQEFDLVRQAIWSDPNDQSAWLYHRWLVGTGTVPLVQREIQGIEELLEEEPDSRWCLDSLVYYKRLLVTLLDSTDDDDDNDDEAQARDGHETRSARRERLNLECKAILDQLAEIDPMRRNRYRDLGALIVPTARQ